MKKKKNSKLASFKGLILRKRKRKNVETLYLDIHVNGSRKYMPLGLHLTGDKEQDEQTMKLAEEKMSKIRREINLLEMDEFDINKRKENFVLLFKKYSDEKPKNPNRKTSRWTNTYNYLYKFTKGNLPVKNITPEWMENFKKYLLKNLSINAAATYYETFKAALRIAYKAGYFKNNIADFASNIRRVQSNRVFLDLDEIKLLHNTELKINTDVKRAFLFCCFTGLRISDVKELKWKNVYKDSITFTQEKTGNSTNIPLSEQAKVYLGKRNNPENKVFHLLKDENTRRNLKKWVKDAGITKNVSFHTSRHTFATLSLTYDIDIYTVSKLLGHSSLRNTQIYAKLIDKKKEEAVKKLPKF